MQEKELQGSGERWRALLFCALLVGMAAVPERLFAYAAVPSSSASTCSSRQSCVFDGISNAALGQATLSLNAAGHLLVSNIGSTGQDGFSQLALPSTAAEVVTHYACPNFAQSQTGDQEVVTFHANVPGGIFYKMTITNIGNNTMEMRPDFSPVGATLYTITVLNGGTVNRVIQNLSSATFTTAQGDQEEIN
jgi:hypothetical protein